MSGMMWTEEGRKTGGRQRHRRSVGDGKNVRGAKGEKERRDWRRKTCRGGDVCISGKRERAVEG